jgi:hypothetical protein
MEYTSGKAVRRVRKRKSPPKWIVLIVMAVLAVGVLAAGVLYSERVGELSD